VEQRFLDEWHKLKQGLSVQHVLLAISGGIDSVVLAQLLATANIPYALAHCNFKLRGAESDKDEAFVKNLAQEQGVELHVKAFDTEEYAIQHGVSIQMAARQLRYIWFEQLLKEKGSYLVTAHHANDVAETLIFNLTKGTGLAGLHGIPAFDNRTIRPLLWATKDEIEAYARASKLSWREDRSNSDSKYARNRIRNLVVPQLQKINPEVVTATSRTAARVADAEKLIDYLIEQEKLSRKEDGHLYIDKDKLKSLPGQATILYRLLRPFGFNYDQVEGILKARATVGATFQSKLAIANIDRHDIIVSDVPVEAQVTLVRNFDTGFVFNDKQYQCRKLPKENYEIQTDPGKAALDYDKLKFPLVVRHYEDGERFKPLGMQGNKLISDFLIDAKVPVNLKRRQGVVTSEDQITWLMDRRLDDRYKITEATQWVYEITQHAPSDH
jgi:tRNA(Ile)-lysidine synthase